MTLSTADLIGLNALVNAYAIAVDDRDFTRLPRFFTSDATLELPDPPRHLEAVRVCQGRDAITSALRAVEAFRVTRHVVHAATFVTNGRETALGTVSAEAHHLVERRDRDPEDLVWILRYRDRYRRDEAVWRFTERRLEIDWIERRAVNAVRVDSSDGTDDQ